MYVCICRRIDVHIGTYIHIYMYVYIYIYMHTCVYLEWGSSATAIQKPRSRRSSVVRMFHFRGDRVELGTDGRREPVPALLI